MRQPLFLGDLFITLIGHFVQRSKVKPYVDEVTRAELASTLRAWAGFGEGAKPERERPPME